MLLQSAVRLVEFLRETAGGGAIPVDTREDVAGLRRVALDDEDVVRAVGDQFCGLARPVQRIKGDDLAVDVAAPQEIMRGRLLAALIVEV